jgi:hypothetical protein
LPNLASAHEQGLADFEAPTRFAVFLPRGASEPIIRPAFAASKKGPLIPVEVRRLCLVGL